MERYLVKKHCEATEICTIATGRIQDYYYGTGRGYLDRDFLPHVERIRALGFQTREEAEVKLAAIQAAIPLETASRCWNITAEIIRVEV